MIRAILFDIGGVLVRTEDLEPRRVWERRFGLPDWGLAKIVFEGEAAIRATLGEATEDAPWLATAEKLKLSLREGRLSVQRHSRPKGGDVAPNALTKVADLSLK